MNQTIQPDGWVRPKGYANGIVAEGKFVFVAGQVGWEPTSAEPKFPHSFAEQFDQALSNTVAVLRAAGSGPEHVVRMTIYVTDKREYLQSLPGVGAAWKKHLGRVFPAMALVQVAGLVEDLAKVEIETTATVP